MNKMLEPDRLLPSIQVDVVESGVRPRRNWVKCLIGRDLMFDTTGLEAYCLANWEPIVYDGFVVAAAVQYCDQLLNRPPLGWTRDIELHVPVDNPEHWSSSSVSVALHEALTLLTGDHWTITFKKRRKDVAKPSQGRLSMPSGPCVVIPFSDGLDSLTIEGLMVREHGDQLIPVRLGSKTSTRALGPNLPLPFASVPYQVKAGGNRFRETSVRSRGFKFALLSGTAAYMSEADQIIMPESGQGALGSYLVPVGQTYEDYRNHPLFTKRMEDFLVALFHRRVRFVFPRLWYTKGETLAEFLDYLPKNTHWAETRSCWQSSRQVSVLRRRRQCGICAACMLRRLSVHAASRQENKETYERNLCMGGSECPSFRRWR